MLLFFFFFKQKTAYEMRISDWSSDVCSSDLRDEPLCLAGLDHRRLGIGRHDEATAGPGDAADVFRVEHRAGADKGFRAASLGERGDALERLRRVQRHLDQIGRASCRERVCQYV